MSLLSVENLQVSLKTPRGPVVTVRDVNFSLGHGETLGIVGESGCGKSMTALAIIGLLPDSAETRGRAVLNGRDLLGLEERDMCRIRGNEIAMIFQEPMTSLNPLHPIGRQVAEPLIRHGKLSKGAARDTAVELLERVGITDARRRIGHYPHQLSGGQRQRVMIAIALGCEPKLLIADEPTTALDVTIQSQILDLLNDLVDETGMALILISHDLGVIGETVAEVVVMYGGQVVEQAPTETLFRDMAHPYTRGLFDAMPSLEADRATDLKTIPGVVPDAGEVPDGCIFADRCEYVVERCRLDRPRLEAIGPGHRAACIRLDAARLGARR